MTKARRPGLYIVLTLRRKYGQLKGLLAYGNGDPQLTPDLGHVGAVLLMFAPDTDLDAIPLTRPYKLNRGRWSRTALQILRTANEPMTPTDLAHAVMLAKGLDPTDLATR